MPTLDWQWYNKANLPSTTDPTFPSKMDVLINDCQDSLLILKLIKDIRPLLLELPEIGDTNNIIREMIRLNWVDARQALCSFLQLWRNDPITEKILERCGLSRPTAN